MVEHRATTIHTIPLTENNFKENSFRNKKPEQQTKKAYCKEGSLSNNNNKQQLRMALLRRESRIDLSCEEWVARYK